MARRRVWVIVAVIVAVVAAGGVGAWWLLRPPSIQDAANSYLHALSDGDIAAIDGMRAQRLSPRAEQTLHHAFAGAAERIREPEVTGIASDGSVTARVRLGGEDVTIGFMLARSGSRYVLNGDYLATLAVTPSLGDAVRVGGALVPAGTAVALLPALYPVQAAPAGLLQGQQRVAVTNEAPNTLALAVTPSPDAASAADAQLRAYEDRCTAAAPTVPANCGLRVPWAADLRELRGLTYRIEHRPALAISADGRSFAATGGVLVATARGTGWDGKDAAFTYRADDWALRGEVVYTGDTMRLQVG